MAHSNDKKKVATRWYYIQRHTSGTVGNCMIWWRKGGAGYTCNLDEAEVFNQSDARFIADGASNYTAWDKDYIDAHAHRHVDCQQVSVAESGMRSGMRSEAGSSKPSGLKALKIEEADVVKLYAAQRELGLFVDKFNGLVDTLALQFKECGKEA